MVNNTILTFDSCKEISLQYNNIRDLRAHNPSVYAKIAKHKWQKKLFNHMVELRKPNNYWTFEMCKKEALKFNCFKDFKQNSKSALATIMKNNWTEELTSHFIRIGNQYNRFVYVFEFEDNTAYIGLTYNLQKREEQHYEKGRVFEYINKTKLVPIFIPLTNIPLKNEDACNLEKFYINDYILKGWKLLNKNKGGALGGNKIKWTFEKLQSEALKYSSKKEFRKNSESAYSTAKRLKVIDLICGHMNPKFRKSANYWSYENCKKEAFEYKTRSSYYKNCQSAYNSALKNKWLDEFYPK